MKEKLFHVSPGRKTFEMKFAVISYAFSGSLCSRQWKLVFLRRIINIAQWMQKFSGNIFLKFFSTHSKSYEAHKAVFIARSFHALLKKGHWEASVGIKFPTPTEKT